MHAPPGARSLAGEAAHATNSLARIVISRSVPACPARIRARAAAMDICVSSVKVPAGWFAVASNVATPWLPQRARIARTLGMNSVGCPRASPTASPMMHPRNRSISDAIPVSPESQTRVPLNLICPNHGRGVATFFLSGRGAAAREYGLHGHRVTCSQLPRADGRRAGPSFGAGASGGTPWAGAGRRRSPRPDRRPSLDRAPWRGDRAC